MTTMKVLALDFDGVISDSAPECFWVSLRTLLRVRANPRYGSLLEDLARLDGPQARESIIRNPLFHEFLALMPLGNRAEDFGVALLAIDSQRSLDHQKAYDQFSADVGEGFASEFHHYFYRERESFRGAQPEVWEALGRPYEGLIRVLHRRGLDVQLAIATAKDGSSVAKLLQNYGIDGLFADGAVVDKQAGRDKRVHMRKIAERFDAGFDQITFIDDKVSHLIKTRELGVRCLLAGWGYNGERERVIARDHGIERVAIDQLEARLFP